MSFFKTKLAVLLLIIFWLTAVGYGYTAIIHYGLKPSSHQLQLQTWPSESKLRLDPKLNTMLVFVHPKCPCSRATLAELDRLLLSSNNRLKVITVFIKPEPKDDKWLQTDLWQKAGALAGVERHIDLANREAKLFQATSSGEVYLFNTNGQLLYHGGITAGRGHEGDNVGRTVISQYLRTGTIKEHQGYAYGCSL